MNRGLIYLTIFLEGYVVLAIELLLMRQLTPFVGSATDIFAIIIAAVLLPLAVGYHMGGKAATGLNAESARRLLVRNFTIAAAFFTVGLIYIHINLLFELLDAAFGANRWLKTTVFCAVFALYPVYLLGQTLPILSTVMPKEEVSRMTGRMLFYSTLGSFCGSIFSTLILMALIGVHNTFNLTLCLLVLLVVVLGWNRNRGAIGIACVLAAYTLMVNSNTTLAQLGIIQNNAYSQVVLHKLPDGTKEFQINRSASSAIRPQEPKYYEYVEFIDRAVIRKLKGDEPKSVLVIGAGGFTQGLDDEKNIYTYLDIDTGLKKTAETSFLEKPLGPNKMFVAQSARSFLRNNPQQYDVIVIDAFTDQHAIPHDLVTSNFFKQVRDRLKPGGVMAMNTIASVTFDTPFSRALDITLREVFPFMTRQVLFSERDIDKPTNVIYIFYNVLPQTEPEKPYSDLLNRHFLHISR